MKTDFKTIKVEFKDGVAVFVIDNPPVNQLSQQFRSDLAEAFTAFFPISFILL